VIASLKDRNVSARNILTPSDADFDGDAIFDALWKSARSQIHLASGSSSSTQKLCFISTIRETIRSFEGRSSALSAKAPRSSRASRQVFIRELFQRGFTFQWMVESSKQVS
jgi:hypothetical protein